jgi:hypothetical protein
MESLAQVGVLKGNGLGLAANNLAALKGHGLSRAANARTRREALAAAEILSLCNRARLQSCPVTKLFSNRVFS